MKTISVTVAVVLLATVSFAAAAPTRAANSVVPAMSSAPQFNSPVSVSSSGSRVVIVAGEGAPMPVCQPGQRNCSQTLVPQKKLVAGEGAPMPVCQPGQRNCSQTLVPEKKLKAVCRLRDFSITLGESQTNSLVASFLALRNPHTPPGDQFSLCADEDASCLGLRRRRPT